MSRIGKKPIPIPDSITIEIRGSEVSVSGPKGEMTRTLSDEVNIAREGDELLVTRNDDSRRARSHQGLVRSLLSNMVEGCDTGFTRALDINGVGYRAEQLGNYIRFELGYSHPILFELPPLVDATVETTTISLVSPDKERVGQVAAQIRSLRPPEPYKGKGIKYREEVILRKAGKAG